MANTGMHTPVFSPEADAVRALLREVFGWNYIEAGVAIDESPGTRRPPAVV